MDIIYLDSAASSWPKPDRVIETMSNWLKECGANPGRGSHQMALKASRIMFECRKNIAKLFRVSNPNDIVFTLNTTMALNLAIRGFIKRGQHIICSNLEHNSVRRPLEYLRNELEVEITYLNVDRQGKINMNEVKEAFKSNTALFICNHSSNLLGTIMPIEEIGQLCKQKGVVFLVDAAQSAGHLDIDVHALGIHMLAFPGHKGLYGPQGTGGLYIHPDLDIEPLLLGGTGSQSELVEQPLVRPDRYESGTQNTVGIAGLNEGVKFVLTETVQKIHQKEWELIQYLMQGLIENDNVRILGPDLGIDKTGIVAFNIDKADPSEVAYILDQSYHIAVRAGYHCTPLAHESAGSLSKGAVRASVSYFTTNQEVEQLITAIREISKHY